MPDSQKFQRNSAVSLVETEKNIAQSTWTKIEPRKLPESAQALQAKGLALCTCEAALRFRAVPWDRAGPGGYLPAGKKISCLLAWDRLLVQCTSAYALRPNRTVVAAAQKLACEVHRWAAQNPLWNRLRPFLTGQYREMLSHSRKVLRHHPSAVMIACCRHYGGKQTAQLCELKKRQQFDLISNDCAVPVGLAGRSLITGFN